MTFYAEEGRVGVDQFPLGVPNGVFSDTASLTSGGFVVTWVNNNVVKFQVFDSDGRAAGEIRTVQPQSELQNSPAVTALSNGGFAIAWTADDGSYSGIWAQTFDGTGAAASGLFRTHDSIAGVQVSPDVVGLADGNFVALWTDQDPQTSETGIFGRLFTPNGAALGYPFVIVMSPESYVNEGSPAATALADGGFMAAWNEFWTSSTHIRSFDADGTPRGPESAVTPDETAIYFPPELTTLSNGNVVVAWVEGQEIKLRLYDASGAALTSAIDVTDWQDVQRNPSLAALESGGFVITYDLVAAAADSTVRGEVFSQEFDQNGAKIGGPVLVNQVTAGNQGDSHAIAFGTSDLAVVWTDVGYSLPIPVPDTSTISGRFFYSAEILGEADDNFSGTDGRDFVFGEAGNDTLQGGNNDDELTGGPGADLLDGGPGTDTARYDDSDAAVFINLSLGKGYGNNAEGDTYISIEKVVGSLGNDTIIGSAGDDTLIGALGADQLIGGPGIDTASYEDQAGAVFVNLYLGRGYGNAAEGDTYDGIENILGSLFNDFIIGDSGQNRLDGGKGDDILIGAMGADLLIGGDGRDTASYEDNYGAVFINLATGRGYGNAAEGDTYQGIEGIRGSIYDDTLIGDDQSNWLDGGDGNDVLIGGWGENFLNGGAGNDTASFEDNIGSADADLETGRAQVYSPTNRGGSFMTGIENLTGSQLPDSLSGDAGANRLDGRLGPDYLTGRGGADIFIFSTAPGPNDIDPINLAFVGNVDTIADFVPGEDIIELHAAVFPGLSPGPLPYSAFVIAEAALDADDRIIYDIQHRALYFDADGSGSGAAVQIAEIYGYPVMAASDFVVV